jgi:hypothetical protein
MRPYNWVNYTHVMEFAVLLPITELGRISNSLKRQNISFTTSNSLGHSRHSAVSANLSVSYYTSMLFLYFVRLWVVKSVRFNLQYYRT